jgi:TPR repeat protein
MSMRVAGLLAALALVPGARAEERWLELRGPHFTVISDAGERDTRQLLWQFEQVRGIFEPLWPWAKLDPGRPVVVHGAKDEATLKRLLPGYWEVKGGRRPAGVFLKGADAFQIVVRVDLAEGAPDDQNPFHTVYHEYVHLLLDLNFERMPAWLNEGLADYFGNTLVRKDSIIRGQPLPRHLLLLRDRGLMPIPSLLRVTRESPEYNVEGKVGVFYAQSWLLVHYLMLGEGRAHNRRINELVRRLKLGQGPTEAAEAALGADLPDLGKALSRYGHGYTMPVQKGGPVPLPALEGATPRSLPPAEVLARQAELQLDMGRPEDARRALEQALRLDAGQAAAAVGMARLALREKQRDQARSWLERAVAGGTPYAAAYHVLAQFQMSGEPAPQELAAAEANLRRSLELDASRAGAHADLARALLQRGQDPSQALPFAQRAVELEPADIEHRLNLAWVLSRLGRHDAARLAGEHALALARTPERSESIRKYLETLKQQAERIPTDPAKAAALLEHRCGQGVAAACTDLGERYRAGEGLAKDETRALGLFEKACAGGDADGCGYWGEALARGRGMPRDPVRAVKALGLACEGDDAWSCSELAYLLEEGDGIPADPSRAAVLYTKACDAKRASACGALGRLHRLGRGVPKDVARASQLLQEACAAGDAWSCTEAGITALVPTAPRTHAEAARFFEQGCEKGNARGCANLAELLMIGTGLTRDRDRARTLMAKACEGGYGPACAKAR